MYGAKYTMVLTSQIEGPLFPLAGLVLRLWERRQ